MRAQLLLSPPQQPGHLLASEQGNVCLRCGLYVIWVWIGSPSIVELCRVLVAARDAFLYLPHVLLLAWNCLLTGPHGTIYVVRGHLVLVRRSEHGLQLRHPPLLIAHGPRLDWLGGSACGGG